jgi:hypothetical protein
VAVTVKTMPPKHRYPGLPSRRLDFQQRPGHRQTAPPPILGPAIDDCCLSSGYDDRPSASEETYTESAG